MNRAANILVYGYGNPGRQDDGLGILCAEKIGRWAERRQYAQIEIESNYQLNVEDALLLSGYSAALFIDATTADIGKWELSNVRAAHEIAFSTHAMSVASVLALCEELYGKTPEVYLLAIKGNSWDYNEPVSPGALRNCAAAFRQGTRLLEKFLRGGGGGC